MYLSHPNDCARWYIEDITYNIVAKSGVPSDRFHLGKLVFHCLKDDLSFVHQIDGATGESETNGSILKRSMQCAISFKKLGLKQGDVMCLMAPNHLDLAVPFYAAMFLGVIISPIDRNLKKYELQRAYEKTKPKIIFCQKEKVDEVYDVLKTINLDSKIVSFDGKTGHSMCFSELLNVSDEDVEKFRPSDFNAEEAIGFLISTSGSTGFPKNAAVTYKCWTITGTSILSRFTCFPKPFKNTLITSPLQWLSAYAHFVISPIMRYTRVQTSKPVVTDEHLCYLINTYKPEYTGFSPTMISSLLKYANKEVDLSCIKVLIMGGSAVHKALIEDIQRISPNTKVKIVYGMSELTNAAFQGPCPITSCGRPLPLYQYRLIDPKTKKDINEANVSGELWLQGPMFKEYYNDPEATKEAFSEDGWLKTGDIFYRDEHDNYYFVERMKILLKYKNHQVSPVEVESVIRQHPGVLDVAVTGVPDQACGELPVACIVPRPGMQPDADEIKELVKENLSDPNQLRGGVVFMDSLPVTSSTKIDRKKLKELVQMKNL